MKYIYVLWTGTDHVDLDGSTEENMAMGYFSSLEELNKGMVKYSYEMPFDTTGYKFNEDQEGERIEKKKEYFKDWVYFTKVELNVV